MLEKYRTILMFGEPGCGKGTQGKILGDLPGFFHLSCGDAFRTLDPNSELGRVFLEYSSRGALVPDGFTVKLWWQHIQHLVDTHQFWPDEDILVLDGIPRNRPQAEIMDAHIDVVMLLYLEATDEDALILRMKRRALHENRLDDANEIVIRNRFQAYHEDTAPVLEHYSPDLIRRVDANRTPIEVLKGMIWNVEAVVQTLGKVSAV
ncbi:MAG: adenylate kinase [Candidatus Latescibacterota bacterium]|jgi:adenylate kinase